jgi:hypothetical protein
MAVSTHAALNVIKNDWPTSGLTERADEKSEIRIASNPRPPFVHAVGEYLVQSVG